MSIDKKTRKINGVEYEIFQLGALEGRRLFIRLARLSGPVLGAIKDLKNAELNVIFKELARVLTEDDLEYICELLGPYTSITVNGKTNDLTPEVQDTHFAGNYGEMFKWIMFALEVNYKDFFSILKKQNLSNQHSLKEQKQ